MIDRVRKFRVGLLVLVCGVTFVTLVAFIAGSTLQRDVTSYRILFHENVKGMVVGSKVNFQGVPIGAVQDIRFQAGQTLVEIRVDPQRAVIQDVTNARLDRLLVTGQVTVELEGYADDATQLEPDSLIPAASVDPISELKASLPSVLESTDALLAQSTATLQRIDRVLSDDNLGRLERILDNLERTTAELPATVEEARATVVAFRPLTEDARAMMARVSDAVDRATRIAEQTGEGLGTTLDESRATLADARRALGRFEQLAAGLTRVAAEAEGMLGNNRNAFRTALIGAADAMRELQSLARQLRAAPNSLLFGADRPEIAVPAAPPGGDR